jgi:hypothetical protein
MFRIISRWWLLAGLWATCVLGCESAARRPYADDPLLMNRKPVVAKAAAASPGALARTEPPPPTPPSTAFASTTVPEEPKPTPAPPTPTPDETGAKPPVPAVPVARTKPLPEVPVSPPIRRQVPETYGHAAEYTWLQGVLDKHYQGQFGLRYCEPSVEDRWGGKVTLADDPRLAQFHDGDQILVEGELVGDQTARDARHRYPTYRIREIWLVQRGN